MNCSAAHWAHRSKLLVRRSLAIAVALFQALGAQCLASRESLREVADYRDFARLKENSAAETCFARIEGVAHYLSREGDELFLSDGRELIEVRVPPSQTLGKIQVGDVVRLTGPIVLGGGRAQFGRAALVDRDGTHRPGLSSGEIHLEPGLHRLDVEYFEWGGEEFLTVLWKPPGATEAVPVPKEALFARDFGERDPPAVLRQGARYQVFEGEWLSIPDFPLLVPVAEGISEDFDLSIGKGMDSFGARWSAWLQVTEPGNYTFHLGSDDGSRLFLNSEEGEIVTSGRGELLNPRILDGHPWEIPRRDEFVEIEGQANFSGGIDGAMRLDVRTARIRLEVLMSSTGPWHPSLIRNARLRLRGVLQPATTLRPEHRPHSARLLVDGDTGILAVEPSGELWASIPVTPLRYLTDSVADGALVRISGVCLDVGPDFIVVNDETGEARLERGHWTCAAAGEEIEALGRARDWGGSVTLEGVVARRPLLLQEDDPLVLKSFDQAHRLSAEEAASGRQIHTRATVVLSAGAWLFLHDSTRSIYAGGHWPNGHTPKAGEHYEISGVTTRGGFSPFLKVTNATLLGHVALPEPLRPSWGDLMSGSLDAQWIELRGIASSARRNAFVLSIPGGRLRIYVQAGRINPSEIEGAAVRVRGFCSVGRSETGQIASIYLVAQSWEFVDVIAPAPMDPFAGEARPIPMLISYHPDGAEPRRVKVEGTVLHAGPDGVFLTDGTHGVRVVTRRILGVQRGDAAEAVGVLDARSQTPVLRESHLRRVGRGELPPPTVASFAELANGSMDARRVQAGGVLVNLATNSNQRILEVQIGGRVAPARMSLDERIPPGLKIGSWVELTGVCSASFGDDASDRHIDSFEILISSEDDIVVTRPAPWWTVRRAATTSAALIAVLLGAVAWIRGLRRQVNQRTRELLEEIEVRKIAEAEALKEP
jgi:hypothetical protein